SAPPLYRPGPSAVPPSDADPAASTSLLLQSPRSPATCATDAVLLRVRRKHPGSSVSEPLPLSCNPAWPPGQDSHPGSDRPECLGRCRGPRLRRPTGGEFPISSVLL